MFNNKYYLYIDARICILTYRDCITSESPVSPASSSTGDSLPIPNLETISSNAPWNTLDEITLKRERNSLCSQEQSLTFAAILTGRRNKYIDDWPSVRKKYSNSENISSNENKRIPLTTRKTYKSGTVWQSVKSNNFGTPSTSSNEDEKERYVREQKLQFPNKEQNKLSEPGIKLSC